VADLREDNFWLGLLKKIVKIVFKDLIPKRKTYVQHVVPYEDRWAVRGEGNERVTETFDYQDDAIERAREIAINYRSAVVIHRKNGSIRDRMNYD